MVQFAILESRMATLGRLLSGRSAQLTAGVPNLRQERLTYGKLYHYLRKQSLGSVSLYWYDALRS